MPPLGGPLCRALIIRHSSRLHNGTTQWSDVGIISWKLDISNISVAVQTYIMQLWSGRGTT